MTREEAEQAVRDQRERLAREQLQQAKLGFERGEFERAITLFDDALSSPVKIRSADDLHDGFLHYAFTLVLQGNKLKALEKLQTAFELKPQYSPSPVTTRPDLLEFYEEQRALFLASGGIQRLPTELFPELAQGSGVVRVRRELPIPLFGIRLRQLGRPSLANALMGLEVTGLSANLAGWIVYAAQLSDFSLGGQRAATAFKVLIPAGFGIWWGAVSAELIISAVLNRHSKAALTAGRLPFSGLPEERRLRLQARDRHARRRGPAIVRGSAGGIVITSW